MLEHLPMAHELEDGERTTEHPGLLETVRLMRDSFAGADKSASNTTPLAERIVHRMIGTKQTKLAGVDEASFNLLVAQVQPFVERDVPIPMTTATGAMKDKSRYLEGQGPDVAELMALSMMHALGGAVREVYSPGVRMQMVLEDLGDVYLNADVPGTAELVTVYTQRLTTLIRTLECLSGVVLPVKESALLGDRPEAASEGFAAAADRYRNLFQAYLAESDECPEDGWTKLASYQQLVHEGWLGTIPQEMRDFYYERSALIHETRDADRHRDNLARLFAAVLARKKSGIIQQTASIDPAYAEMPGAQPVRFSFAAPTPGMPTRAGRVFLRPMPRSICSKGIPFWCADGVLVSRQEDGAVRYPGIRGRNDPLFAGMRSIRGKLTLAGQEIDAALLREA